MDTQNVSAQLYFKQLPMDPNSGNYGCNSQGSQFETTCVNDVITDANIENAFQSQLNLDSYYKTPGVFNTMKTDYMDRTLGGENFQNANPPMELKINPAPPVPSQNSKSTFGNSSRKSMDIIKSIKIIILFIIIYFIVSWIRSHI
jgi:hypothetical protein